MKVKIKERVTLTVEPGSIVEISEAQFSSLGLGVAERVKEQTKKENTKTKAADK